MINIKVAKSAKCNGEWSLFVTFPYSDKIVEVIRSYPSRFWNKDTKEWELPFKCFKSFIDALPDQNFDIHGDWRAFAPKKKVELPANFKFKTNPFQHQIEGFEYGLNNDRWLLGDEQGLGKTKQVIDIAVAKKLVKGYKHCLIVCGVNGLKWNWLNEIHTHSNEEGWILGQRWKAGKLTVGSIEDRLADLKTLHIQPNKIIGNDDGAPYFLITNVETLRSELIASEIQKLCKEGIIGIVAIDEIHKCKNPSSQQGKGILKIQPECRIAMTGTPLMNNPFDLYIILKWLGYEKHAFYAFKKHYGVFGGYGGYEVTGYRYLDELQAQLDEIMLRRLKADVLDLPEKTHITEYVEMTPKQKQIYDEVTADIKMNIDQIKMANNPLAELIRMRQATGYTGILSSTVKESAKLDRMEELVEEARENGKQVVIFSNWTQMTDAIYERLHKKYTLSVITGETKDELRQHNVKEFQEGRSKVIIGTIGAMGTGLTLTAGTVEIFMDEPWNRANKEQAEDRCHRVGTTENVTIYTLVCKDTIDEKINQLVEKKGAMADALVDGKIAIDKSNLLDFLIG
ncbi:DEAD/DEAH box helicase [bacterium]|nr:DEAD/DEAH box helicase [bacterium]